MYLHSDAEDSADYVVLDLDTGNLIGYCRWADDVTGKYCVANVFKDRVLDALGEDSLCVELDTGNDIKRYEKQGNIKILDKAKLRKALDGLDKYEELSLRGVVCNPSPGLAGSELCMKL